MANWSEVAGNLSTAEDKLTSAQAEYNTAAETLRVATTARDEARQAMAQALGVITQTNAKRGLAPLSRKVIDIVRERGPVRLDEVHAAVGGNRENVRRTLENQVHAKYIVRVAPSTYDAPKVA